MSGPQGPARRLPPRPNLDQQRTLARELLRAANAHEPEALDRVWTHHPRFAGGRRAAVHGARFSLHDAQLVLAREYGFASWPKLKAHLDALAGPQHTRPFVRETAYYDDRARGLLAMHVEGLSNALDQIRRWHPRFAAASDAEIRAATLTLDDARLVYAREHGFERWHDLLAHVEALAAGRAREPFADAFDAMREGDHARFAAIVRAHPEVVQVRGTNGNTLLNLAGSLSARPAGPNTPRTAAGDRYVFAQLLLDAGADVDLANDRGWTPLHQAAYSNQPELITRLLAAGAAIDVEAHGEGGTPLAVALFWGHRAAAEVLAAEGVVPRNLRIASALGRADLVHECFTSTGELAPHAGLARGFYRPHSGFPVWGQSSTPQEILDEALVWAAKNDRVEVLPLLVARRANVAADPYRGTPLTWAAAVGALGAVRWLLDHGADVNQRGTFGGPAHGQGITALHIAAQDNRLEIVRLLLDRGADLTIEDELYHGTPLGWAEHGRATEALQLLRAHGTHAIGERGGKT